MNKGAAKGAALELRHRNENGLDNGKISSSFFSLQILIQPTAFLMQGL
jgi:hypothetical protein